MREITKIIFVPVDEKLMEFRLTKLDAFSGVSLLRILATMDERQDSAKIEEHAPSKHVISTKAEGCVEKSHLSPLALFSRLSDVELHKLMTVCLEHTEVNLPAGWIPVLTRGEWSYPEISHDTATCLKLALEEAVWTLEGFFGEGASDSRPEIPVT